MRLLYLLFLCSISGLKSEAANDDDVEVFFDIDDPRNYKPLNFDLSFKLKSDSPNELCNSQLQYFQDSLDENVLWARKMRDAWGNVPSGIFSGNQFDFGNFDQCIRFKHEAGELGEISGQHCTLMVPFDREEQTNMARINTFSKSPDINLGIGICVPNSCHPNEVKDLANDAMQENFNISLSDYNPDNLCSVHEDFNGFSGSGFQIFAILFFATFLSLLVLSTAYEVRCNIKQSKKNPLLAAFSVYTNSKIIMTMKPMAAKEMLFLHGIRSVAILWIIVGHTFNMGIWLSPQTNQTSLVESFKNFFTMILFSSYFGVNTFFMLSSLLLTLSVFRELDKTNKINLPRLYLKRYVRITVPLAAVIIFSLGFFMHLSNGPLWKSVNSFHLNLCKEWWWTTLLYVANHVNPGKYCFWHSWYLMVDMQLYFLSPLVLYPIWRFQKRVKLMIAVIFLVASSTVIFILVSYSIYGLRVSHLSDTNGIKDVMVYTTTYGRIDSWMMGILIGYIMYIIQNKTIRLSKAAMISGWTCTVVVLATAIFGQYPLQQENFNENPLFADAIYDSLKGIFWGLAVGWIILACHLSFGGIVKRFLSLSVWLPISKLSFCIYLVHVPIQTIYTTSVRNPAFFSYFRGLYLLCGTFGTSFVVAFAWALLFEYPILTIIAIILSKQKSMGQVQNQA